MQAGYIGMSDSVDFPALALPMLRSQTEPVLDQIARVAAAMCAVPIALVVVDESRSGLCKAAVGLTPATDTDLFSLWVQALFGPGLTEIQDIELDPRGASRDVWHVPSDLRFYAGVRLLFGSGRRSGTLCVVDREPRQLTTFQRAALVELGKAASSILELGQQADADMAAARNAHLLEARLAAIVRSSDDAIVGKTAEGIITTWNAGAEAIFGYSAEEIIGQPITVLFPPDRYAEEAELIRRIRRGEAIEHYETQRLRKDGSTVHISASLSPILDEQGTLIGVAKVARDITQRKHIEAARRMLEQRLSEQHELMKVTLNSIGDAVITTDLQSRVQWMNPVAEHLTGWSQGDARGLPLTDVFVTVNEETRLPALDPSAVSVAEERIIGLAQHTVLLSRDGTEYGIEDSTAPIKDGDGRILGAVLVFHDVTEQRRLSREMTFRATHDALTGLVNRDEFEVRVERALTACHEQDVDHVLMYIDLDQFKLINDTCGHSAGDLLLQQIGALICSVARSRDTIARLGGDEFGVLMEYCTTDQARRVAQHICDRLDEFRFAYAQRHFRLGASIGLAPLDRRWASGSAAFRAADTACYSAKEAGRNRVRIWRTGDEQWQVGETEWVSQLDHALDQNQFELFAQVVWPLQDKGERCYVEVLLRLRAPDGALIAPSAFLPAAERFHMATRLDRWVVKTVFAWMNDHPEILDAIGVIAVNLSGQSVGDPEFHMAVDAMVRNATFDVRKLCFEVTETAAVTNLTQATAFTQEMSKLGVQIALDDFGAGASSFGYLRTLQTNYLKIDGRFVRDMLDDALSRVTVKCFHEAARAVGVKTIAEWVETAETLEAVRAIGVDFAQGFLLQRPVALGELRGALAVSKNPADPDLP